MKKRICSEKAKDLLKFDVFSLKTLNYLGKT